MFWFVHLGLLDLHKATVALLRLFPDDAADEKPRTTGFAPLATLVLDADGLLIQGKSFLPSFPWGYGKARAGALQDLATFPDAAPALIRDLEEKVMPQETDGTLRPLRLADLEAAVEWLVTTLDLPTGEIRKTPAADRVPVRRKSEDAPEPDGLNSFFLEDLTRVRHAYQAGDVGAALRALLSEGPRKPQQDVVRDQPLLRSTLAPTRTPLIRWPGRGRFPLVLMQQAALNHVSDELQDSGLLGINGPPGTGKTTLLRDVIAKVVLDRAQVLASFEKPKDAFQFKTKIERKQRSKPVFQLDPRLLGHEIVVASSNNKAVENISREIPDAEALADDFDDPPRYFASIAACVAAAGNDDDIRQGSQWGLSAAVLGRSKNRKDFVQAFWWHDEWGLRAYLNGISFDSDREPAKVIAAEGAPADLHEAEACWTATREDFLAKLEAAQRLQARLEEVNRDLQRHRELRQHLGNSEAEARSSETELAALRHHIGTAQRTLTKAQSRESEVLQDRHALLQVRPSFFARLFGRPEAREWRQQITAQLERVQAARESRQQEENALEELQEKASGLQQKYDMAREATAQARQELNVLQERLAMARAIAGEPLPNDAFWHQSDAELQTCSPWLGPAFQAARDDLFAAAFAVHKAFIGAAVNRLRCNLDMTMELLKGGSLPGNIEELRSSFWASLFLVVPVISTTFASVSRLFGSLGREQLGWLLIDEAGQAVPQAAVGAIWRSRRVVSIGDPLQIEPVITIPERLIRAICKTFDVDGDRWSTTKTSVQSLADRVSWFGTHLQQGDGAVWVGSPLRVHRRCEDPMFTISNEVAYNGLMVHATASQPSRIGKVLGTSKWLDIDSESGEKWSRAEGDAAVDLLGRLFDARVDEPDIYFITPFRNVANKLRQHLRSAPQTSQRLPGQGNEWLANRVGTVHTFQGKEAEAVVLVLGAPSEASAGARYWAGGSPNLLNVAVSRAKRRLYVIGKHAAWKDIGVFRTLAELLPSTAAGAARMGAEESDQKE